jgi:hypothetical protein
MRRSFGPGVDFARGFVIMLDSFRIQCRLEARFMFTKNRRRKSIQHSSGQQHTNLECLEVIPWLKG